VEPVATTTSFLLFFLSIAWCVKESVRLVKYDKSLSSSALGREKQYLFRTSRVPVLFIVQSLLSISIFGSLIVQHWILSFDARVFSIFALFILQCTFVYSLCAASAIKNEQSVTRGTDEYVQLMREQEDLIVIINHHQTWTDVIKTILLMVAKIALIFTFLVTGCYAYGYKYWSSSSFNILHNFTPFTISIVASINWMVQYSLKDDRRYLTRRMLDAGENLNHQPGQELTQELAREQRHRQDKEKLVNFLLGMVTTTFASWFLFIFYDTWLQNDYGDYIGCLKYIGTFSLITLGFHIWTMLISCNFVNMKSISALVISTVDNVNDSAI
jgi:hypothetical protein